MDRRRMLRRRSLSRLELEEKDMLEVKRHSALYMQ